MADDTRSERVDLLRASAQFAKLIDIQRRIIVMMLREQGGTVHISEATFEGVEPSADMFMRVDRATRMIIITERKRKV